MIRNFLNRINQVDPDTLYTAGEISGMVYESGEPAYKDIVEAKKSGRLPFIKDKIRHLIKGADLIAFLQGNYAAISTERQRIDTEFDMMDDEQKKKAYINLLSLSKRNINLASENRWLRKETERLRQENDHLRSFYAKRENLEEERREKVIEVLENRILRGQSVQVVGAEFVNACGVYFLIKDGEIVYIGQSVNIASRVGQHKANGKEFDEVRFFLCEKEELNEKEMFMIRLLKPRLNGAYKNHDHQAVFQVVLGTDGVHTDTQALPAGK